LATERAWGYWVALDAVMLAACAKSSAPGGRRPSRYEPADVAAPFLTPPRLHS
jgi:hypothetical protein